jgi:rRNA processing protein Krr1/Pno1
MPLPWQRHCSRPSGRKYARRCRIMSNWNQLLAVLDKTIGFPNRIDSNVKKIRQGYDEKKNEHVIYLEYRVRVKPGGMNVPNPEALRLLRDLMGSGAS